MAEKTLLDIIVEYKEYLGVAFIFLGLFMFWAGDIIWGGRFFLFGLSYTVVFWFLRKREIIR